jgi:ATP-dependent exoDNAse (exonuclease V) alpha subunit
VQTAKMEEVLRQKTDYMKAAVKAMSEKNFESAFGILSAANSIKEYRDHDNPINGRVAGREALVAEYLSRSEERQDNTIITVQKNSDREVINNMIRDAKGLKGQAFEVQKSASISPSDAFFAESYKGVDSIFALEEMANGKIKQNESLKVISANEKDNTLLVQNKDGKQITIDLSKDAFAISAYQKSEKNFDVNDKILFTKNDSKLGVQNGVTGRIEEIDGNNFTVRIGEGDKAKTVSFNSEQYNFIDHGYAITEYAAQGQTAKEALAFMRAEDGITTQNSVYVAITRAENDIQIFTDSK